MKASSIITTVLLCILAALFALWAFGAEYSLLAMLCAAVAAGLFGLCIIRWIPALWGYCTSPAEPLPSPGYRASRFDRRHPWARIALMVLLLHAALYILAYAIALTGYGYSGGVLDTLRGLWLRSDSPSYLGIAENWYVTEGDPRFHIVFFPLYPILIRIFMLLTGDAFWAAMLVSTLCAIGSVIMAYELAALDMPRSAALYAALLLCLLPGNIFLAAPMTEALFLLLSLSCAYCARRRKYLLAGLFGALGAFTRSQGILLAIPILLEAAGEYREGLTGRELARRLGGAAMVALGLMAYLGINYAVTGSPFTFLTYQREHWHQGLGAFWNTAAYQLEYLMQQSAAGDAAMVFSLYLPNLISIFAALGLMLLGAAGLRPAYTGYALSYFAMSVGATWLLSGPRYLSVCFPLAFALAAAIGDRRGLRWAAALPLAICMAVYLGMYVSGSYVY